MKTILIAAFVLGLALPALAQTSGPAVGGSMSGGMTAKKPMAHAAMAAPGVGSTMGASGGMMANTGAMASKSMKKPAENKTGVMTGTAMSGGMSNSAMAGSPMKKDAPGTH